MKKKTTPLLAPALSALLLISHVSIGGAAETQAQRKARIAAETARRAARVEEQRARQKMTPEQRNTGDEAARQAREEKENTVRQLKTELLARVEKDMDRKRTCSHFKGTSQQIQRAIEDELKNLDPLLIGKNVVFSREWLRHLDRNELGVLRDHADKIHGCFAAFSGRAPMNGSKVLVGFSLDSRDPAAHAHSHMNLICFDRDYARTKNPAAWVSVLAHEMGHIFNYRTRLCNDDTTETLANLFRAYALEQLGNPFSKNTNAGKEYRAQQYNHALDNYRSGKIKTFNDSARGGSAFDLYVHGGVGEVGYEPYKKAIRENKSATPREFFNAIERFSGRPGLFRTLPDEGWLLDNRFTADTPTPGGSSNKKRNRHVPLF